MIEKLIREDGKVAVLIHADFGAGWSSTVFERKEEILSTLSECMGLILDELVKETIKGGETNA